MRGGQGEGGRQREGKWRKGGKEREGSGGEGKRDRGKEGGREMKGEGEGSCPPPNSAQSPWFRGLGGHGPCLGDLVLFLDKVQGQQGASRGSWTGREGSTPPSRAHLPGPPASVLCLDTGGLVEDAQTLLQGVGVKVDLLLQS